MTPSPTIRPLEPADIPETQRIAWAALEEQIPAEHRPATDRELHARRARARIAHLQSTDAGGAWVAEVDGEIAAVALALVREGVWGLSLFAVRPGLQGQGIGRRVLQPALDYGNGARGGIILSTTDPRAMRRYFRAGFRIKPCVTAGGQINRSRIPASLRSRPGDVHNDRHELDAASRHVRSAAHGPDVEAMVAAGGELLVIDGHGFAVHREGSPMVVAATDDEAAADLLWGCLAGGPPGGTVHVDFISEGNDWAVRVALDAGLALGPEGPVFVRGETGPFAPYLPSGAYL